MTSQNLGQYFTSQDTTCNIIENMFNSSPKESLGCYFTPASISRQMFELCEPYLTYKHQSFLDPFAGSGGLAVEFIEKMDFQYIHLNDININIVSTLVDIFAEDFSNTNTNMISKQNVKITNYDSFKHKFDAMYDVIVTNPPYGSSGFNINSYTFMEKLYDSLNPNGIMCILLPDAVFKNDDVFKGFEKLSVTSVQYEQTGFKFSIGVFKKSYVVKHILSKRTLDFDVFSTPVRRKLDFDNIDDNLSFKQYGLVQHIIPRINPTVKSLEDISTIYNGLNVLPGGDYVIIKKHRNFNNISYVDEPFYKLSKRDFVIKAKNEDSFYSTKNIYNYLMKNKHLIDNMYKGSALPFIRKLDLEKLVITLN